MEMLNGLTDQRPWLCSSCTARREGHALTWLDLQFSLDDAAPKIGYAAFGTALCRSWSLDIRLPRTVGMNHEYMSREFRDPGSG